MPATTPEDKPEDDVGLSDGLDNPTAGDVVTGALLVSADSLDMKTYLRSQSERC